MIGDKIGSTGRLWVGIGSLIGLGAVAMAAAAAHGLPGRLDPAALEMTRSAVQIQGWHALALLFTGLWAPRGGILVHAAGMAFAGGTLLFCGAVYALALFSLHLPLVAPTGGVLLMLGWLLLGMSAFHHGARGSSS
jgi:uncharacterized membrane protein YgdD (TMEM256/DUF423 family)